MGRTKTVDTMYSSSALRLLCSSHCQLRVGSSLPNSHCAPQFAQLSIPDAFYNLQPSFSQVPAAVIVLESYRAHSTKNRLKEVSCNKNLGSINNFNDFKTKVMSQEYNHSTQLYYLSLLIEVHQVSNTIG